jgi:hypothetical protein
MGKTLTQGQRMALKRKAGRVSAKRGNAPKPYAVRMYSQRAR